MGSVPITTWVLFHVLVFAMLALDLGVFNRRPHAVSVREALRWTGVWVIVALLFCAGVFHFQGTELGMMWLTSYLVEKSLSIDNIFVFVLIFSYFRVDPEHQHRVLYWGILGALVMRAVLIAFGVGLVHAFEWSIYFFGAFLIFSGLKFAFQDEGGVHPERNPVFRTARRYLRVTPDYLGARFFVRHGGRLFATPLILVLLVVESTDLLFALDSIPAVLAITTEAFTVYTSNVLAILGLRALYFALAGVMDLFHLLKYGLSFILVFIGVKMVLSHFYKLPTEIALGVIMVVLCAAIGLSLAFPKKDGHGHKDEGSPDLEVP